MTDCILYARFSPRRNAGECESIDTQLEALRAHATAQGYTVAGEFRDEAMSGADADLRSQLLEQKRAHAGEVKQLGEQLTTDLRRAQQELRAEKADLSSLITIFSDMAVRLSEELEAPPAS